jgi:hypothetical protein
MSGIPICQPLVLTLSLLPGISLKSCFLSSTIDTSDAAYGYFFVGIASRLWYQELKDRFLEVIKLRGSGGRMVTCFAAQLYGEKMNLPDAEVIMYKPSERWEFWFNFLHLLNRSVTPPLPPRLRLILCLDNLRHKLL